LESDVIIYDLISNSFEEVDYVIKTLKTNSYEKEKTLVLLSSVMAWFNTPPKFEEEKAEDEEGEGEGEVAEEEGSEEEPPSEEEEKAGDDEEEVEPELDENGEPIVVKEPIYFKENDFHQRVPHVDFNHFKTLETTAMSSTNTQPKLRVHVLCSGVRYGNGERTFYDHFQKAWVQNPASLTYFKEGANLMPTIHVVDLARLVRRVVIENPKVHPYIFAIDKSRKPTTQRIVEEISKGMGTGKSSSIEDQETVSNQVLWKMPFMLDLRMRASDAFKAMPLSEADAELEQEEQDALIEKNKFPWHCKYGIRKNIAKLNKEFNEFRGLNPVKIYITGPPASGKTFYADKLAKFYNIPKVEVKQLVAEVFRMAAIDAEEAGENALINDCIAKIQEVKEKMEEDINEKRAEMEEPEEGWPEIEIKDSEIRVPDELLYKVLKLKLAENACRNRGYILDGFPRTYKDAQNIFLYRP
jgi:adenylate kinase